MTPDEGRWGPQPTTLVYAPPRYPSVDYTRRGIVSRLYVPVPRDGRDGFDGGTLGWLVLQGEALGWLSLAPPQHSGHPLKGVLRDHLRTGAHDAIPAATLWPVLLDVAVNTPPHERPLPDVVEEFHALWGV